MAAPLSGVGQQQIPLSQPFQPGGSDQTREIRQRGQEPRENELQARGTAASQTQQANTKTDSSFQGNLNQTSNSGHSQQSNAAGRGSVIDITV